MAKKISPVTPQMRAFERQIEQEFDLLLLDYVSRAQADQKKAWDKQFRQLAKAHRAEEKERRSAFLEAGGKYPAKIVYGRAPDDLENGKKKTSTPAKKTSPPSPDRQESAS